MNCENLKEQVKKLDAILKVGDFQLKGISSKALILDLSSETFSKYDIPRSWLNTYVGGPALGARLWAEFAGQKADDSSSYEKDNPVVIVAPSDMGNNMTISFLSPQTGRLMYNNCQNAFGTKLRDCGYYALIIVGRMRRLSAVKVSKSGANYEYVEKLAGLGTIESASAFKTTCLTIGPAGENRIKFATCICDGQSTGRGGLGYVLGQKNIKSVCVISDAMKKPDTVFQKYIQNSKTGKKLLNCGTNFLINNAITGGWAPISNFRYGTDPRLFHLSGDETRRRLGDYGIFSGCGYEETLMLGSNCNCFDIEKVVSRHLLCIDLGIDSVSVGCMLGWIIEANEKKLVELAESVDFADNQSVLKFIESIAKRTGMGEKLSQGIEQASEDLNASYLAYSINGLECGPFDFRGSFAQALNSVIGNVIPVYPALFTHFCSSDVSGWTVMNEDYTLGLCSLGIDSKLLMCILGDTPITLRYISGFVPHLKRLFFRLNKILKGTEVTQEAIETLGKKCWRLTDTINTNIKGDCAALLPDYFRIDSTSNSKSARTVPINKLFEEYCYKRSRISTFQDLCYYHPEKQKSIKSILEKRFF